ncbi:MAG: hypothetical protein EOO41_03490, partial [Methanobacteriota archaeon]
MAKLESPFAADGLQSVVAARDQQIALLSWQLRVKELELADVRGQLSDVMTRGDGSAAPPQAIAKSQSRNMLSPAAAAAVAPWLGSDESGVPISAHEKRTLNALVRRYLLARGYRATVAALEEDMNATGSALHVDEEELLALPGSRRSSSARGRGVEVLTLLSMHRNRIAPIQALAESEARSDSELASLRNELRAAHEQLELVVSDLDAANKKVEALQEELLHAKTTRGAGTGATTAGAPVGNGTPTAGGGGGPPTPAGPVAQSAPSPASSVPRSGGGMSSGSSGAGTISLANAPALLRVVVDAVPTLSKHMVTRQRSSLMPLMAAAIATEASLEGRRALLTTFFTLIRRPSHAERQVIHTQLGVLASKMGQSMVENEIIPELLLLAKTGKTKERKALAAI